jgi:general secretion pathway protein D
LVCPLENAPAQDVSSTLNNLLRSLGMLGQLRSEVVIVPDVITNSLVISATPEDLEKVTPLVRQLDRPQPSVRVEVLIAEVQQAGQPTAGPPKPPSGDDGLGAAWEGWDFGQQPGERNALARLRDEPGRAKSGDSNTAVRRRLAALAGSGQLRILNRAQVTTLDNQPAFIHVGRRIPVPRSTATTAAGARTMSMSYEDTGVIVGVTPRISRGGRVAMEINVEKSGLGSTARGGNPGGSPGGAPDPGNVARPPQNDSIRLQTTVNLADGESTVIGGLAVESQPRQSRLVIMVTPHVIPPKD